MAHADSRESGIELREVNRAQSIEQIGEDTEETQSQLQIKTTKRRIVSDDKPYHYHSPNHSPQAVTCNWHMYFVGGYRILSHLLLLYCVIGVTYLLISTNNNSCTCIQKLTEHSDQQVNLNAYTVIPTALPTLDPTDLPHQNQVNLAKHQHQMQVYLHHCLQLIYPHQSQPIYQVNHQHCVQVKHPPFVQVIYQHQNQATQQPFVRVISPHCVQVICLQQNQVQTPPKIQVIPQHFVQLKHQHQNQANRQH
eukprot:1069404_1